MRYRKERDKITKFTTIPVEILDARIKKLPITQENADIVEELIRLPYPQFYSIMLELVNGHLRFEDLRPSKLSEFITGRMNRVEAAFPKQVKSIKENISSSTKRNLIRKIQTNSSPEVSYIRDRRQEANIKIEASDIFLTNLDNAYIPPQFEVISADLDELTLNDDEIQYARLNNIPFQRLLKKKQLFYVNLLRNKK